MVAPRRFGFILASRKPQAGRQDKGDGMRAFAAVAALAALATVWRADAEAAEARIGGFAFECVTPEGKRLKPKFGDIDGVFYTDLPYQREQCLATVARKIALCRENVDFASNTENRDHAGCLPVFRQQAEACAGHFAFERGKCGAGGPGRDGAAQDGDAARQDDYRVAPLDKVMELAKRANVRAGPGTEYDAVATLDAGVGVRVTGEVEGGGWLRVDVLEDDGPAFIYAPLLKERGADAPLEPFGPNWIVAENQPCQLRNPYPEPGETVTWTGPCVDGRASGEGRWVWRHSEGVYTYEGGMRDGAAHGRGTFTGADGHSITCQWRNYEPVDGTCK